MEILINERLCNSDETEIGLGLTAFGIFFSFLGVIFFFDKGLLAMGNVSKSFHHPFIAQLLPLLCVAHLVYCCFDACLTLCCLGDDESDSLPLRGDVNHWTEVLVAVLHET